MLRPLRGKISSVIFLLLVFAVTQARQYSTNINVNTFRRQESWSFIDRIHLYPGHITVNAEIKLTTSKFKQNSTYNLELVAIPQPIWSSALQAKCDESKFSPQQLLAKRKEEKIFPITLDEYRNYKQNLISKIDIPAEQTFHFVLRDCQKRIVNDGYGRDTKLQIKLIVRNNELNIGAGQQLYGWALPLLLLASITILYFLHKEKEEEGDNWIKFTLKFSLWIGVSSILFKYLGFLVYAHGSGIQHGVFDVFYLLLHSISDSIIMVLLMLLSFGWTVTFKNARDFDLYVPLACMLGLVNVIMTMLNKIQDGEHDKYHMYDTIPAYIMIGFRLIGLLVFFIGIIKSWLNLKKGSEEARVKNYLIQMTTLGLVYLAFVPIGFVVIRYVSTRYKKEGMFFSVELVRFGMSYWLALLAGWKKSVYRTIIDQSFMEKGEKFY